MGREKLELGAHLMVSALSRMGAVLEMASVCAWSRDLGSTKQGKWRRLSNRASAHRATLPTQLPIGSIFTIPDWLSPKPQHMGRKEPSLRQKTTAGEELSWVAGRGEGAKVHACEDSQLVGTFPAVTSSSPVAYLQRLV